MTRTRAVLFVIAAVTAILSSTAAVAGSAFDRALSLAFEERFGESRRALDPILQRDPDNFRAQILHGILRVHEGHRDEAIGIFHELVREFPDSFEPYNNLAVLYVDQGRLEDARGVLLAILERRPEALGYQNLGDIYVRLARRAYARGRELGQGQAAAHEGSVQAGAHSRGTDGMVVSTTHAMADDPAPAAEVPDDPSIVASSPNDACMSVGRFRKPHALDEAQTWLRSHGAKIVDVSQESDETIENYRVYLPPFESRRSASEKMRELQSQGVRDIAVIPSGSLKNAVSLGVFASKKNLERRVAHLEKLGHSVVWEPNTTAVDEYLTIKVSVNGAPATLSDAWESQYPTHSIRRVDCG